MNLPHNHNEPEPDNVLSKFGFQIASIVLLVPAVILFWNAYGSDAGRNNDLRQFYYTMSCVLFVLAVILLCVPSYVGQLGRQISSLPRGLRQVSDALSDLDNVRREYYKLTRACEAATQEIQILYENQGKSGEDLKRILNAAQEMMSMRQERGKLNSYIQEIINAIRQHYEVQARLLSEPGISDQKRDMTEKYVYQIDQSFGRFISRIAPQEGEEIDPRLHKISERKPSNSVPADTILKCDTWGYKTGDTVLSLAEVIQACHDPIDKLSEDNDVTPSDADVPSSIDGGDSDNQILPSSREADEENKNG